VRLEIRDESEELLRVVPLQLAEGSVSFTLSDLPCGYWRLRAEPAAGGAGTHAAGETLLAIVPAMPELAVSSWTYGCHIPVRAEVRQACWKLGLRWNRFHDTCKATKWSVVQPTRDDWHFDDDSVAQHLASGHGLIGSLAALPAWVSRVDKEGKRVSNKSTRGNRGMIDETFTFWEEYARRCAAHWRGKIDFWEVTNEPNLSGMSPVDYLQILQPAYRGVKAGNPDAVVVGLGGATPAGSKWILDAIALGAGKYADALSFHGYGSTTWSCSTGPEGLIGTVDRMRAALREAGTPDTPLWDSECGVTVQTSFTKFHVPHGGDAIAAAQMFPKSAAAIRAAGIERVLYYSAHDTTHAGDGGLRWLCDFNGVVKRPAVPLAVAISLLEGKQYLGKSASASEDGVVHLEFRSERELVHMMWTLHETVTYDLPSGATRVLNMWGREIASPGKAFRLTPDPVYAVMPALGR